MRVSVIAVTTASVSSVEPSSTITTSRSASVWASALAIAAGRSRARL